MPRASARRSWALTWSYHSAWQVLTRVAFSATMTLEKIFKKQNHCWCLAKTDESASSRRSCFLLIGELLTLSQLKLSWNKEWSIWPTYNLKDHGQAEWVSCLFCSCCILATDGSAKHPGPHTLRLRANTNQCAGTSVSWPCHDTRR